MERNPQPEHAGLSHFLADAAQIRRADAVMIAEYSYPGLLLMEAAGRAATAEILRHFPDAPCYLILAGPGNNGGDGLVVARCLRYAGKNVCILHSHPAENWTGDPAVNRDALLGAEVPQHTWDSPEARTARSALPPGTLLIDALLGTGTQGALRAPFTEILDHFRPLAWPCVALDLPTGLDASTGAVNTPPLPALHTLSFGLPKICHHVFPAAEYCGAVTVLDIGIWPQVIGGLGIRREITGSHWLQHLPARGLNTHKGNYGHALLAAGAQHMAGAAALAGLAALRTGAGFCTVLTPGGAQAALYREDAPELMCLPAGDASQAFLNAAAVSPFESALTGKSAVAIGPGLGHTADTAAFLRGVLPRIRVPLVLDADALNLLAAEPSLWQLIPKGTILTPHPGEMARLYSRRDVKQYRLESAEDLAQETGCIVVLKGAGTVTALPDGRSYVNTSGNPGMATAGAGDVLTGILLGLLAQGIPPETAAPLGVWLHGHAGDLAAETAPLALSASLILQALGSAGRRLS